MREWISSGRWSSGWPQGIAPAQLIHAVQPTSPRTSRTSGPSPSLFASDSASPTGVSTSRPGGQAGSHRHAPRTFRRSGAGSVERCAYSTIGGSRSTPLSMPLSQWSHHFRCSGIRSWFGPGIEVSVDAWAHGPKMSRFGQVSASNVRNELLR